MIVFTQSKRKKLNINGFLYGKIEMKWVECWWKLQRDDLIYWLICQQHINWKKRKMEQKIQCKIEQVSFCVSFYVSRYKYGLKSNAKTETSISYTL